MKLMRENNETFWQLMHEETPLHDNNHVFEMA